MVSSVICYIFYLNKGNFLIYIYLLFIYKFPCLPIDISVRRVFSLNRTKVFYVIIQVIVLVSSLKRKTLY